MSILTLENFFDYAWVNCPNNQSLLVSENTDPLYIHNYTQYINYCKSLSNLPLKGLIPSWSYSPCKESTNNRVFVFGSNLAGIHGKGAAKVAVLKWGAILGKGEGLQGQSYAFPTKDKNIKSFDTLDRVKVSLHNLMDCARENPHLDFTLTRVGCGLAGYPEDSIIEIFNLFKLPPNIHLPYLWLRSSL